MGAPRVIEGALYGRYNGHQAGDSHGVFSFFRSIKRTNARRRKEYEAYQHSLDGQLRAAGHTEEYVEKAETIHSLQAKRRDAKIGYYAAWISGVQFPELELLNSLDLLTSQELLQQNGHDGIVDFVHLALRNAGMRVPPSERPWIVNLLGDDRARVPDSRLLR